MRAGASARRQARRLRVTSLALQTALAAAIISACSLVAAAIAAAGALAPSDIAGAALFGAVAGGFGVYFVHPRLPRLAGDRGEAAVWKIGAEAEEATAALLAPLADREGWRWLHDRALPRRASKANLDHLGITPCGQALVVVDTKRWRRRGGDGRPWTVWVSDFGGLFCGPRSQENDVNSLLYEAEQVIRAAGSRVRNVAVVMVVHGAPVDGGHVHLTRVLQHLDKVVVIDVVSADALPQALRSMLLLGRDEDLAAQLAAWAETTFPAR